MLQFISTIINESRDGILGFASHLLMKKNNKKQTNDTFHEIVYVVKLENNVFTLSGYSSISKVFTYKLKDHPNYYGVAMGNGRFKMVKEENFDGDKSIYKTLVDGDNVYFPVGNIKCKNNEEIVKMMYYMN